MKRIKLGDREVNIQASPMTLVFYKREFGQSFSGDLLDMQSLYVTGDQKTFDDVNLLQMIWAMEKTVKGGNQTDFITWLGQFEWFNLADVMADVLEEGRNATFREPPAPEEEEPKQKPKSK